MIIMATTIVPMVALAYWLSVRTKPGMAQNFLIFVGVSILAIGWGAAAGAVTAAASVTEVAPAMVSGMVAGVICIPLLIPTLWMGRKNARQEAASAWKYR